MSEIIDNSYFSFEQKKTGSPLPLAQMKYDIKQCNSIECTQKGKKNREKRSQSVCLTSIFLVCKAGKSHLTCKLQIKQHLLRVSHYTSHKNQFPTSEEFRTSLKPKTHKQFKLLDKLTPKTSKTITEFLSPNAYSIVI